MNFKQIGLTATIGLATIGGTVAHAGGKAKPYLAKSPNITSVVDTNITNHITQSSVSDSLAKRAETLKQQGFSILKSGENGKGFPTLLAQNGEQKIAYELNYNGTPRKQTIFQKEAGKNIEITSHLLRDGSAASKKYVSSGGDMLIIDVNGKAFTPEGKFIGNYNNK